VGAKRTIRLTATTDTGNNSSPFQDLTPPSDAEADRTAPPPPVPNQPTDTTKVPSTLPAQPKKNKDDSYTFVKDVEEVMLYATVVDPRTTWSPTWTRLRSRFYEDGQPQQITSFRRDDIPVSLE